MPPLQEILLHSAHHTPPPSTCKAFNVLGMVTFGKNSCDINQWISYIGSGTIRAHAAKMFPPPNNFKLLGMVTTT